MTDDDDKLRDQFARLRRMDARRTPSLDALARAPKVRPLRPAVLAAVPLVAAAAALLLVWNGATRNEPPLSQATAPPADVLPSTTLAASPAAPETAPLPLDFLLQTRVASTDLGGSDFLLRTPTDLRGQLP